MRIALVTWGTRGEVQPYVALGHELDSLGHDVVLSVNDNHVGWACRAGLPVARLPLDFHAAMIDPKARGWLASGNTGTFFEWLAEHEHEVRHEIAHAMIEACSGADLIVSGFLCSDRAAAIAESRDIAFSRAFIYPIEPTKAYASPYLGNTVPALPRDSLRLRSHQMARRISLRSRRADLNEMRTSLGLMAIDGGADSGTAPHDAHTVHLFDERVLPRPDDWPSHAVVTGYCFLPSAMRERLGEAQNRHDLDVWLAAGTPPVFFGFGSMPVIEPEQLLRLIEDVCRELGIRALVGAGWSRLPSAHSDDLLVVDTFDHDALLPRCRAAVHHGGAGTTAASLRAGVPTVVCSVFGDQSLWGHRVSVLGVGATLPFQRLSRERLVGALRIALSREAIGKARALGEQLRAARGRSKTADALVAMVTGSRRGTVQEGHA